MSIPKADRTNTSMGISNHSNSNSIRWMFAPIASGLLMAQCIATIFVMLSNSSIYAASVAIDAAGFLPIPFGPAMAALNSPASAIWGGLFFTLSIGTGLTLVAWAAIRIWSFYLRPYPMVLMGYGVVWAGLILFVNLKGLALFPTLLCLLVPLTTGAVTWWGVRKSADRKSELWFAPVVVLILLTALWSMQSSSQLFTAIRDQILLSNPVGQSINDFYYRYTLYAAEAFKPFNDKTVRTGKLEGSANDRLARQLKIRLARYDIVTLDKIERPDITIRLDRSKVVLMAANGSTVEAPVNQFMRDPGKWLTAFSIASDRMTHFRIMILIGLFTGFPILLYVIVYGLLRGLLGRFTDRRRAVLITSALCMGIGILLFLPMLWFSPVEIDENRVEEALMSDQWTHRVAALRYIEDQGLEISRFPSYENMLSSEMMVERYWLARAMAGSREASTYPPLLRLLEDKHPNVICQAFFALGKRGQRRSITTIRQRLVHLDHWYAQWYGYRAMRRLGWYQVPSK